MDNLFYTQPATGDPVATDNIDGIHYQRFKLDVGNDGESLPITGSIYGLPVDVHRHPAIGETTDAEATGDGSVIGILKRLRTILTNVWDSVNSRLKIDAVGNVAHGTTDSGNPVKTGAKALAHRANPTAVDANQRTDLYASRHGVPWVIGGHPNIITVRANYTAAQTDTAIVTVGAGTKIVVTRVLATVSKPTTASVSVIIGFGTTNTPTTNGVVAAHPGIGSEGGFSTGDGSGILGVGADNEDLRITSSVPTNGALDVVISYYTVPS